MKKGEKVICIEENYDDDDDLVIGKQYIIDTIYTHAYLLDGVFWAQPKYKFISLKEQRKQKINKIYEHRNKQ